MKNNDGPEFQTIWYARNAMLLNTAVTRSAIIRVHIKGKDDQKDT